MIRGPDPRCIRDAGSRTQRTAYRIRSDATRNRGGGRGHRPLAGRDSRAERYRRAVPAVAIHVRHGPVHRARLSGGTAGRGRHVGHHSRGAVRRAGYGGFRLDDPRRPSLGEAGSGGAGIRRSLLRFRARRFAGGAVSCLQHPALAAVHPEFRVAGIARVLHIRTVADRHTQRRAIRSRVSPRPVSA